jgi:hypothetical protein
LLAIKEHLFIKDDIPSRDNNTLIWNPDPINIGRVIANKVANMGLQI